MNKLSVVLATFNEEGNIKDCLESVRNIADEIVIVDGKSTDKTREIVESFKARIIVRDNPRIFHINKQIALENASHTWILQLDADERVSENLAAEITSVISMSDKEIKRYQDNLREKNLFDRHKKLLEERDGKIGSGGEEYSAFFIPRLNYFLGKYLRYGGVYPDGVIRLVKKEKARFPAKSVHEQIEIDGRVGWLANPLYHMADISFKHYLKRNSVYIDHIKEELKDKQLKKNIIHFLEYMIVKPVYWFLLTQARHKGILDGWQGIVFSFFSALRFPRAYIRYIWK